MGHHIAQKLSGGAAQRLRLRCGHLEIAADPPADGEFRRDLLSLAAQRGPQVERAALARPYPPGQRSLRLPGLGHQDAPRQRLVGDGDRAQDAQYIVVDRIGRTPLGFFRGEGGILDRELPGQLVGRVVGLARTRPHEPRGHTGHDHRGPRGHRLLHRKARARLPEPSAQDHQQQGDGYGETGGRPYRPGGGGRHHHHVCLLLQERAPRHGQDPGRDHQDHRGRRQQVEVPLGRRPTERQQGLSD